MTPENTSPDKRCRACSRIYHRDYYTNRRSQPTLVTLFTNLVNALDSENLKQIAAALRAGRDRLTELGRFREDRRD